MVTLWNYVKEPLWTLISNSFGNLISKPIENLISNTIGLDEKMQNLERRMEELKCQEIDVNRRLEASAEIQLGRKRQREVVGNWLENVKKARIEFESLQKAVGETRFYSFSRVQLGGNVARQIKETEELVGKGNFSEGLSFDELETREIALPTTGVVGQTFRRNCEEILRCLKNDEVLSMGIYGMGGVGKTTVMKHVHNQMLEDQDTFGSVYWVTVSQNFEIDRLQSDISKNMGLDLSKEGTELRRAACLFEALKKKGKYVLILDDVWDDILLESVGIPVDVNQCKLILTTRFLDVCNRMVCQEKLKILPLPEEEAWELFTKKLGPDSKLTSEIRETAQSVARSCAGLPLAIITMAASMRVARDIHEWRFALEELKNPSKNPSMGPGGDMERKVFRILEYSYKHLGYKILQFCFLYCALYPEDFTIPRDELIVSFIAEGVTKKGVSRQAEIDTGHVVLNILENRCLLESSVDNGGRQGVKMHDLIREMALQIMGAGEGRVMVKAGLQLSKIPEEVEWTEDLKKVSLMNNQITVIPAGRSPSCRSLSTLMLQNNHLWQIPNSFFVHLHGLRILNLCHNYGLEELPNSIGDLGNLNALLLRSCRRLKRIPSLGNLRELTDLDLGQTGLTEFPQGMEELLHLKCLFMDGTKIVGMIPSGILPRLPRLHSLVTSQEVEDEEESQEVEVYEEEESQEVEVYEEEDEEEESQEVEVYEEEEEEEDEHETVGVGVRAKEVMELKQLKVFQSRVCNLGDYNRVVKSEWFGQLLKYHLLVTSFEKLDYHYNHEFNKTVELNRCNLRRGGHGVLWPRSIQSLKIHKCSDTGSCLFDVFHSWNDATELKELIISYCEEVEWVVKQLPPSERVQLPSLETLRLKRMRKMKGIFKWELGVISPPISPCGGNESFSSLKQLDISYCKKMKVGLTVNCLLHLPILEELDISECEQMEEIIGGGDNHSGSSTITLPKLRKLRLKRLPELKSIYRGKMICDSIQEILLYSCKKLKRLGIGSSWSGGDTDGQETASPFPALEELSINCCLEMEEIIGGGDEEGEEDNHSGNNTITLPKLRKLELYYLPELKSIYRGKMICDSDGQETASPFPALEEIDISYCKQMEEIIGGGDEEGEEDNHSRSSTITLPKLRKLYLWKLQELKSIYRGKMICDSIQEITLGGCPELKRLGIGSSWSGGDTDGQETASPFPHLERITISQNEKEWWESVELEVDKSLLQPFVREFRLPH